MSERANVVDLNDPRMQSAIRELETLIRFHYPAAVFSSAYGEDPDGVYLDVTVDLDDTDEVVDVYIDRLLDLQIEDGLSLHVIPLRTPARIAAMLRARERAAESPATVSG